MIDILDRVRCKELQAKICTAEEAAAFIKPGMNWYQWLHPIWLSKGCTYSSCKAHGEGAFPD